MATAFCAIGVVAAATPTRADLLSAAFEAQLEAWLGLGDLTFQLIFTKTDETDAAAFHAAVDGMGPTITIMSVVDGDTLPYQVIGGYNPQSWRSDDTFTVTTDPADRTAFIFNLTDGVIQRQSLGPDLTYGSPDYGENQTYNSITYGPAFGQGDLTLDAYLSGGCAVNLSYGGGVYGPTITSGGNDGWFWSDSFSVLELQVYTFTSVSTGGTAVPDSTATAGLLGLGLLGLFVVRRKRALVA